MRPNPKVVGISLLLAVLLSLMAALLVGIVAPAWCAGLPPAVTGLAVGGLGLVIFCALQKALARDT